MKSQIAAAFWPALCGAGVLFMLYILFVPNPEGQARAKALAHALRRALDELLDGGAAPKPRSGWAVGRERAAGASVAASVIA